MSRYTPPTATMLPSAAASSACLLPSRKPASRAGRRLSCSCKATAGDDLVDRRDVLLGLTGLAASSNLGLALAVDNACTTVPVTAPVLKCDGTGHAAFYCPAEYKPAEVIDFSAWKKTKGLPGSDPLSQKGLFASPARVRRPVHLLGDDEVKRFEEGIRLMKDLPDSDPRSFRNQRAIHEAYCDKHYNVVAADGSTTQFDVHFSSIFAPWHRMYIYFFERILGELVGDDTFALPYWNWDSPDGMRIPSIFTNEFSPLHHCARDEKNLYAFMDLNMGPATQADLLKAQCTPDGYCRQLKDNNLFNMYRQMTVDSPTCFHGTGFCKAGTKTSGSLETGGHTAAHIWVGGDMKKLKTAARDPIFYTNHSNADRLWHLWSTKLGGNDPMDDEKWLATSFVFYDEKQQPVRIAVEDVLDVKKLGYTYEKKDRVEWLDKRPKPANLKTRIPAAATTTTFPFKLNKGEKPIVTVERPEKARAVGLTNLQEVLVVDMTVDPCEEVNFEVLVNVPRGQEDMVGPSDSQNVGSYMQVAHGPDGMKMEEPLKVSHRFRLGELIQDLNAGGDRTVQVTLVPVNDTKTQIIGMRVEALC